jgi:hypothetical protein
LKKRIPVTEPAVLIVTFTPTVTPALSGAAAIGGVVLAKRFSVVAAEAKQTPPNIRASEVPVTSHRPLGVMQRPSQAETVLPEPEGR